MKIAVILFNLGGPDSTAAIRPFLTNLFRDPAIIGAPGFIRLPLAHWIAARRAPVAAEIYGRIGGRSPILPQTAAQAQALTAVLQAHRPGDELQSFVCMRYWHPMSDAVAADVLRWHPDRIVLLPLYPQLSTATSVSSVADWTRAARRAGLRVPTQTVCCYFSERGLVAAAVDLIRPVLADARQDGPVRLLFSAHGLPKRTVARGDPYQWQVEQTAQAIAAALGVPDLDWRVCYQSRVGPLAWIEPSTEHEIRRAAADKRSLVIFPVAFVSEHSETLVELDIEYADLARRLGVPGYRRVPTLGTAVPFIDGLARLVEAALADDAPNPLNDGSIAACPQQHARCPRLRPPGDPFAECRAGT